MNYKDKSRQIQIWFSMIIIFTTIVSAFALTYIGKDISSATGIITSVVAGLTTLTTANYITKPKD